jgi:hypothetical protein
MYCLCCSVYFCVVLYIVFVTFPVLFVCICVLNNCYRVATQLQLNISYRIVSYHIIYHIVSYRIISYHIISYHIIYIISYHHIMSYHITSYHIISHHITSYHIISHHKMQATRSFDMWTVSQWPRATCQEIVILDNTAMETSKLKCGILLILYNSIECTFHLSSHLLNIYCWSPYNNNVTNVIFLAKYFTVISKHRTYREFSPVSNKKFFLL